MMIKYLIFIFISFLPNITFSQSLNEVIRAINFKYNKIDDVFSYEISSSHKSLVSDTVNFHYSTHVICNNRNQNDSIKDFICTLDNGNGLYAFLNNELLKHDTRKGIIHSQVVESPYKIMKRGEFKWAAFTPFIFKKPVIDTFRWNDSNSDYSISKDKDTMIIEMCNTFANTPIFYDDDPVIGTRLLKIKVHMPDTLIFFYKDILTISRKPEVTTYSISNYRFYNNSFEFDSVLLAASDYMEKLPKVVEPNWGAIKKESQVDLKHYFSDTFRMHGLHNDSLRLNDLEKRYYIIDFWFRGCFPCIKASEVLNGLAKAGLPNNTEIIGINFLDRSPEKIREFVEIKKLVYDQYYLKSRDEIRFLDWYGAPTIVLYDRHERRVVDFIEGFNEQSQKKMLSFINDLNHN